MEIVYFTVFCYIVLLCSIAASISFYRDTKKKTTEEERLPTYEKRSLIFLLLSGIPNIVMVLSWYFSFYFNSLNLYSFSYSFLDWVFVISIINILTHRLWTTTIGVGFGGLALTFSIERKLCLDGKKGVGRIILSGISLLMSLGLVVYYTIIAFALIFNYI